MASKDRILRLKEETRINILDASLKIVKEEGWQALSMRKIADMIEYTAPIIYEYFANKDAILVELTRRGFLILAKDLEEAKSKHRLPAKQLEAMWFAYWNFAFANKELYQVMFGVQTSCSCELVNSLEESDIPYTMFSQLIGQLMNIEVVKGKPGVVDLLDSGKMVSWTDVLLRSRCQSRMSHFI